MSTSLLPAPSTLIRFRRTIRASTSFTVPDGVYRITGLLVGAGGGGGGVGYGSGSAYNGIGGSAGGGYPLDIDIAVIPGDVVQILIGAGGSQGGNSNTAGVDNSGTPGGSTTLLVNGVAVLVAPGGAQGGGLVIGSVPFGGGDDAFGGVGSQPNTSSRCGGGGAGYTGGKTAGVGGTKRARAGRNPFAASLAENDTVAASNGVKDWSNATSSGSAVASVEPTLVQPKRFYGFGAGGFYNLTPNVEPAAKAPNTGAGGDAANLLAASDTDARAKATKGGPGSSGVAMLEWELTA